MTRASVFEFAKSTRHRSIFTSLNTAPSTSTM
eukprot:CAMPEP_0113461824 /NCGR_PEP_ID=MMETSP0014_2-20120614/11749_1 /TAXON_ID=2857 /ORGANISM="Nitzschia sp." /LENGTH=31 /DNA_ID=CAMNT_0000353615 /DNA_START=85 /DNA_END=177 /DNA_ORIENTATION=- /assembly_acc=CAM_ASM_000159